MHVMAGLLINADGRVLLAERPQGKHLGGFWEFPGGKVEPGELPLAALARELREELGIELRSAQPLIRVLWTYHDRRLLLDAWRVDRWDEAPQSLEGQALQWWEPAKIDPVILTPADRPILQALRLPSGYALTPADITVDRRDEWVERIHLAISTGTRLLQLHLPLWPTESVRELAAALLPVASSYGATLLLHDDIEGALALGIGVHLSTRQMLEVTERVLPWQQVISVSCHDTAQLAKATDIRADFAVLSPAVTGHVDASSMDWPHFQSLAEEASLPVYTMGAFSAKYLIEAKRNGGQGVAGVNEFWPV
jgi:8-oxo-dGTP diphosphatase